MASHQRHSNWVEIDLEAIRNNVHRTRHNANTRVMAVVKADAYGHGVLPVARAVLQAGASWLAVARATEALELREAGITTPILILGYTPVGQIKGMIDHQISLTVWTSEQADQINEIGTAAGAAARVHLKVDTGMGRLGICPEGAPALAARLGALPFIDFQGVFTHFARADESDPHTTDQQESRFRSVLTQLEEVNLRPPLVHAANSAAGLRRPSAYFDLIRLGIAMYGLAPSGQCPLPPTFRPALRWVSVLSHVKVLPPGHGVSYGHIYKTSKRERIGTIPAGYADGYRRVEGAHVLVRGQRVPVVGRVCMDQFMVSLDSVPEAQPGAEVVLLGEQGEATYSADDLAEVWGTINYEVVCAIGKRVPRVYK